MKPIELKLKGLNGRIIKSVPDKETSGTNEYVRTTLSVVVTIKDELRETLHLGNSRFNPAVYKKSDLSLTLLPGDVIIDGGKRKLKFINANIKAKHVLHDTFGDELVFELRFRCSGQETGYLADMIKSVVGLTLMSKETDDPNKNQEDAFAKPKETQVQRKKKSKAKAKAKAKAKKVTKKPKAKKVAKKA